MDLIFLCAEASCARGQAIKELGRQVEDLRVRLEETQGTLEDRLLGESGGHAVEEGSARHEMAKRLEECKSEHDAREKGLVETIAQVSTQIPGSRTRGAADLGNRKCK